MVLDTLRENVGRAIVDMETPRGQIADIILYTLNIIFLGLYVASTYDLPAETIRTIYVVELVLAFIFLGEYLLRIDYADDTLKEMFNLYTMADLIAIIPVFLIFTPFPVQVGFLRGFSVLRVFRFLRYSIDNKTYLTAPFDRNKVLVAQLATTIVLLFFITAGFFHTAESGANPNINNFGDALYFSVVALSTVGFGDIVPVTTLGKLVISVAIIIALVTVPWQAGRIIRTWDATVGTNVPRLEPCVNCEAANHAPDAIHCKYCGEELPPVEETI